MKQSEYLQINPSERGCHDLGHEKYQKYLLKNLCHSFVLLPNREQLGWMC